MNPLRKTPENMSRTAWLAGLIGSILLVGCVFAVDARAQYEQVQVFPAEGSRDLTEARGIAINYAGAGGAEPGSVYVVGRQNEVGIQIYDSAGVMTGHLGAFGPEGGVAVDQANGDIYVVRAEGVNTPGAPAVHVYSPGPYREVAAFGEMAAADETIAESPAKLHLRGGAGGIAVAADGTVYVQDEAPGSGNSRIMVFEPEGGDVGHYVYAGQARDFAVGIGASWPTIDDHGNIYAWSSVSEEILEWAPGAQSAPICHVKAPRAQMLTVNPVTGAPFYFSFATQKLDEFGACDPEGEFRQLGEVAASPSTQQIEALAVNPVLSWTGEGRPPGVVYGINTSWKQIGPGISYGLGYIFAPAPQHSPKVLSESVAAPTASSARLEAEINPAGIATRYRFQYITTSGYEANGSSERFAGASEAPVGGAQLPGLQEALVAVAPISGLPPDTQYHYRVIAENCTEGQEPELCEVLGPDQTFRTYSAEGSVLPDGRVYELVSPVQKSGGQVFVGEPFRGSCPGFVIPECKPGLGNAKSVIASSPEGNSVVYMGNAFNSSEGAAKVDEYLSQRGPTGWSTAAVSSPFASGGSGEGSVAFDPGLTKGLLLQGQPSLTPDAPSEVPNLYRQATGAPGALSPIILSAPEHRPPSEFEVRFTGASSDLGRAFFAANDALTDEAVDGGSSESNLYEATGGEIKAVNLLPGASTTTPGASFGSGSELAASSQGGVENFSHAISADGTHAFWTSAEGATYVRIDGARTLEIPDPGRCDPKLVPSARICFLTASSDGSQVLLSDGSLYAYSPESDAYELTGDLSGGQGGFRGILGQSDDLSSIYFVDSAALTPEGEVNADGAHAEAGVGNLYSWENGSVSFVATLVDREEVTKSVTALGLESDNKSFRASPAARTAEASPDGRMVAFMSTADLTGYDNTGKCDRRFSPEGPIFLSSACTEVYLFDSSTGALACVSCNPSGQGPIANSVLPTLEAAGYIPQPRYLADSGRLFFDTGDSLSPFDTNAGTEDVYEYELAGVGSCLRAEGCVSLISAGNGTSDSNFLAADPRGENVFFTTRDQLVGADRDQLFDLYDARVGGGFVEPATPAICQGESCQSFSPPPAEAAPASSSFPAQEGIGRKKPPRKHHNKKHHRKSSHKKSSEKTKDQRHGSSKSHKTSTSGASDHGVAK